MDNSVWYFQCNNSVCKWYLDLIVIPKQEIALDVFNEPKPVCSCGMQPVPLRVRGE